MEIARSKHGVLAGPPYHDGVLKSLLLARGKASLCIVSTDGSAILIEVSSVSSLSVLEFVEDSIVNTIYALDRSALVHAGGVHDDILEGLKNRLLCGVDSLRDTDVVFVLECSNGADIILVGESVSWSRSSGSAFVPEPSRDNHRGG